MLSDWIWKWLGLFVFLVAVLTGQFGCTVVGTGPKVAQSAVEAASGAIKVMLAQYQPDQMHADVSLDVNDPRYTATVFVGVGTMVQVQLMLEGAEASVAVNSSGKGVDVPLEVKTELLSIIGNGLLSDEERKTRLVETLTEWLSPAKAETKTEHDPPAETKTPVAPSAWTPPAPRPLDPNKEYRVTVAHGSREERLVFRGDQLVSDDGV